MTLASLNRLTRASPSARSLRCQAHHPGATKHPAVQLSTLTPKRGAHSAARPGVTNRLNKHARLGWVHVYWLRDRSDGQIRANPNRPSRLTHAEWTGAAVCTSMYAKPLAAQCSISMHQGACWHGEIGCGHRRPPFGHLCKQTLVPWHEYAAAGGHGRARMTACCLCSRVIEVEGYSASGSLHL